MDIRQLTPLEPLLTIDDVAVHLGVPKATLYRWRTEGKGPRAFRFGKHLRFDRDQVQLWLVGCADDREAA